MKTTSIHIQKVKQGSETLNTRNKELDYVRTDLSHLNESWSADSISNRLATIKEKYYNTVGQKMQAKAAPIKEGVVVIKEDTTMQDLRNFADRFEKEFGVKTFQIHIHKDQGFANAEEWKPNLHAHMVFDWTRENGKSCRLKPLDLVKVQTILAESLNMERGKSSDATHLNPIQYKNGKLLEQDKAKDIQIEELKKIIEKLNAEIKKLQSEKQ